VRFSPTVEQQHELAKKLGDTKEVAGLSGQFVVQYDVSRDPEAGEVLVSSITTCNKTTLNCNRLYHKLLHHN
jgi:hypothetical protein